MTASSERWSMLELELFHDEQLDTDHAAKLAGDLCRDPSLRTRLATVGRVDEAARTALLQPREALSRSYTMRWGRLLAAACLVLTVGVGGWLASNRTPPKNANPLVVTDDRSGGAVRVVFSVPLPPGWKPSVAGRGEQGFQSRVSASIAEGRIEEALELLAAAPVEQRREGYRHLGELLQSAQVAERILDRLSPGEQLAACNQWAADAAMRPVVFARLRRLSAEPSLTSELNSVLVELSGDPALRAWLRGYQLQRPG